MGLLTSLQVPRCWWPGVGGGDKGVREAGDVFAPGSDGLPAKGSSVHLNVVEGEVPLGPLFYIHPAPYL